MDLAIEIQQIPAPTFEEGRRAEFVRGLFVREGLRDVSMDEVGNVYGRWSNVKGQRSNVKPLVISAHLDTVFPAETDLRVRREGDRVYGPGIGDNSLGVAALFGVWWELIEKMNDGTKDPSPQSSPSPLAPLPLGEGKRDIWFVANVGEEGLGDLRGMKAVVDRFGAEVTAYLVLEGMALGHVYHRAVGVKRYRITARTMGGHSWSDYGKASAIHELAGLVMELTTLKLPSHPRTTMNVGKIAGGTSINTIAAEAWLELDLRSEGQTELAELIVSVENVIRSRSKPEVSFEAQVIGERPAGEIASKHPLVQSAMECIRAEGLQPVLTVGSTDANIPLSMGYPALVLGVTTGGAAHTVNEFVEVEPVGKGLRQLVSLVVRLVDMS